MVFIKATCTSKGLFIWGDLTSYPGCDNASFNVFTNFQLCVHMEAQLAQVSEILHVIKTTVRYSDRASCE